MAATEQLKLELAVAEEARDASYATATQAQNEAATAVVGAQRDKALQDLAELQANSSQISFKYTFPCGTELRTCVEFG